MFRRRRTSSDFRNEVDSHLQIEADLLQARGLNEADARAAARRAFGNVGQAEERFFEALRWLWWDHLWQDIRLGARIFSRNPGFTAVAVMMLALGIGANTAIFSIVNRVLLRPLPFPNPEELVFFGSGSPGQEYLQPMVSPAAFAHYRTLTDAVRLTSAFQFGAVNLTGGDRPERLARGKVSADFFALFGAPMVQGRTFSADEDLPSGPRVAVLSSGLWTRRFGADPGAIGKTILLDGEPHTIVGVLGSGFDAGDLGAIPEVFTPFQLDLNSLDQGSYFRVAGRLMPGVTVARADARVAATTEAFRKQFPQNLGQPNDVLAVRSMHDAVVAALPRMLLLLTGAVSLVLILACANVANLLIIRATGRRREIVLRATLGARRGRIVRQLLTESGLLAVLGGTLGLGAGVLGIRALLTMTGVGIARITHPADLGIDWRILVFVATVVLATGILFGILPALTASKPDLTSGLKEGGGRTGTGFRLSRVQSGLVVAEVALAVVLLTGAALLLRTLFALNAGERGFEGRNVQTMTMSLRGTPFQTSARVAQLTHDATERLAAMPDVEDVTAGCCLPLRGNYQFPFDIVGKPLSGASHINGDWLFVGPRYFEVFKIPIVRGRGFTERDLGAAPQVAIINDAMAKKYWPDGDPLQDRILIPHVMKELETESERQIVGIVGDIRFNGLQDQPWPAIYLPTAQVPDALTALMATLDEPLTWSIRTSRTSAAINREVRNVIEAVSGVPIDRVESMDAVAASMFARARFNTTLMTIFGVLALTLATIGIYGVMAYSVKQRTQEIGIRMALGARQAQVRRLVIGQGMWLAVAGLAIGMSLAIGLARLVGNRFFWPQAAKPVLFIAVVGALGAVALFSVWLPAVRASAVDPVEALRAD